MDLGAGNESKKQDFGEIESKKETFEKYVFAKTILKRKMKHNF